MGLHWNSPETAHCWWLSIAWRLRNRNRDTNSRRNIFMNYVCLCTMDRFDLCLREVFDPHSHSPVRTETILSLHVFAANSTWKRNVWTFVRAFVDHQIVRFRKSSLTIFTNKLTFRSHFTSKIRPTIIAVDSHHRKHFSRAISAVCILSMYIPTVDEIYRWRIWNETTHAQTAEKKIKIHL